MAAMQKNLSSWRKMILNDDIEIVLEQIKVILKSYVSTFLTSLIKLNLVRRKSRRENGLPKNRISWLIIAW